MHDLLQHHGNWHILCFSPSVLLVTVLLQPCAEIKCSTVSPTVVPNVCLFNRNSLLIKKLSVYIYIYIYIYIY